MHGSSRRIHKTPLGELRRAQAENGLMDGVRDNRVVTLVAALILGLGVVVGGYLMGDGIRRARMADRAVTMRGLAERDVTADLATWSINFGVQGTDLASVQAQVERDAATVRNFFRAAGFPADAVTDGGGSVSSNYDSDRGTYISTINRRLQFRTTDVMRARAAYARQFDLIRSGVPLQEGSNMVYSFTRLNQVKPAMIHESTLDARRGAEQFARDSGAQVGGIRSATQGYFSIGARDGDASEEGSGAGDSPFQKVRVVTTIEFYLR
jgi:hypothetical protein